MTTTVKVKQREKVVYLLVDTGAQSTIMPYRILELNPTIKGSSVSTGIGGNEKMVEAHFDLVQSGDFVLKDQVLSIFNDKERPFGLAGTSLLWKYAEQHNKAQYLKRFFFNVKTEELVSEFNL